MPDLYITKALPNPAGKDRTPTHQVTVDQLNGEWLEFQNISNKNLNLEGVHLDHYTFDNLCRQTGEAILVTLNCSLASRKSMRVHTGRGQAWWEGDLYHVYAGHGNYVWNNRCGDIAILRVASGGKIDWASYLPNPGEGRILQRQPYTNTLA
jgi:hypothetical protein